MKIDSRQARLSRGSRLCALPIEATQHHAPRAVRRRTVRLSIIGRKREDGSSGEIDKNSYGTVRNEKRVSRAFVVHGGVLENVFELLEARVSRGLKRVRRRWSLMPFAQPNPVLNFV